jgi:hypothetical protein
VVVKGRVVLRYADHDETFEAGDAYYGTEVVEFSPSVELQQTMAVVGQNLEAVKAAMSSATPA